MNDPVSENVVPFNGAPRRESSGGSALQILGRCRNLTTTHIERNLKEMLDNTDDALFKLAEQADDNRTQGEYFDAMREVRRKRSTMESEYPIQLSRVFDVFLRGTSVGRAKSSAEDMEELSLVGDEELEENLALEGMISKAARINETELYNLTRRLAVALDSPKLGEDAHPMAPAALCEAFRSAMKVLDVNLQVRLIIYKLFDKYVVSELPALYVEVNQRLAEMGLLPDLRGRPGVTAGHKGRGVTRGTGQAGAMPDTDGEDGAEGSELMTLLQHLSGQSGSPLPPGVTLVDRSLVAGALSRLPAVMSANGSAYSGAQLKDAVLAAVNGGDSTGVALNRMDETAIDIVAMLFDFIFEDPALPAPIKELIGRLQIPVLRVAIVDKTFFSRKKHPARRLLNELAHAGIGWTEAEEREDGLRTRIESMVERITEDFDGDVSIFERELSAFMEWCREQAERAAQREEHSALAAQGREHLRVAKAVASEAIGRVVEDQPLPEPVSDLLRTTWQDLLVLIYLKDGQHGKLWQKALNVASLLVWSLLPKPTAAEREQLTDLLPSLLRALQEGMTRMSCTREEQDGILAVLSAEHARLVRDPEMNLEVEIPPEVLTDGAGSDAAAVDGVMEPAVDEGVSAAPDPDPDPDPASASASSISEVEPEEVQDGKSFMARKVAEINQLISEGRFKVYEEVVVGDGAMHEAEDLHLLTARELEEGTWLELRDQDGNPCRVKLSWKSLISGKYFFVNRQGLKVRELTVPALATEFREGRARLIEDVPVFDRAISTLMASLSSSAK